VISSALADRQPAVSSPWRQGTRGTQQIKVRIDSGAGINGSHGNSGYGHEDDNAGDGAEDGRHEIAGTGGHGDDSVDVRGAGAGGVTSEPGTPLSLDFQVSPASQPDVGASHGGAWDGGRESVAGSPAISEAGRAGALHGGALDVLPRSPSPPMETQSQSQSPSPSPSLFHPAPAPAPASASAPAPAPAPAPRADLDLDLANSLRAEAARAARQLAVDVRGIQEAGNGNKGAEEEERMNRALAASSHAQVRTPAAQAREDRSVART